MSKDDLWPEVPAPTIKSIVRDFLEKYNRWLVGTRVESNLVEQLEKINQAGSHHNK